MASSEAAGGGDGAKLRLYQRASKPRSEKTAGRWMGRAGTKARQRTEERRSLGTFRNRASPGKERTSFEGK
jgi:hypothetical protein